MKVFFDDKPLREGHAIRGIGSYTRNLLGELKKIKDINLVDSIQEADVVHYPYSDLFFNTLNIVDKPTVVTTFDTIPLIYPEQYKPGIRGKANFLSQKSKLKKVDAIITISETSKKDIVRFLDIPQDKICVIHLSPSMRFKKLEIGNWKLENKQSLTLRVKKRYGLPDRFVLYVGDVNYNKNIKNLIEACKIAKIKLVICGKQATEVERSVVLNKIAGPRDLLRYAFGVSHPELAHFKELSREFNSNKNIFRLGFVPEEDLVGIYNLATVYCQPSLYEGFGLPVLEAMASGCPVVASKTQTLVEIAENCAIFVNPKDPKNIADGLQEVITNKSLTRDLVLKGLIHAQKFTWTKTANETLNVYKKVGV